MMKIMLWVVVTLVALVCAFPQDQAAAPAQPSVQILKQDSNVELNGYNFEFETSDGTSRQEQGDYKNDTEQQGLSVRGSYKFTAPDGQKVSVTYIADKNGYQATEHKDDDQPQPQQ